MKTKPLIKRLVVPGILVGIYLFMYIIFCMYGQYSPTQSGKTRYQNGLSITDVEVWQPRFIVGQLFYDIDGKLKFRGNTMGYIYAPVLLIDQKHIHKTIWLINKTNGGD